MVDAIIVGAGPAGSMAALVMARAGARVILVDRATFPRDTLCGDRLSPGTVALLGAARLEPQATLLATAVKLDQWRIGVASSVAHVYRPSAPSYAIRRRAFDTWLLEAAIRAGARFESGWHVRRPLFDDAGSHVRGVVMRRAAGADVRVPALMVIAADGRHSLLARHARLHVPSSSRYRAAGVYLPSVDGIGRSAEIHVVRQAYFGVTPVGEDGFTVWGICRSQSGRDAAVRLRQFLAGHAGFRRGPDRLPDGGHVRSSGLVVSCVRAAGVPGLLLAGDAAGTTGPVADGIRGALLGGQMAAEEALASLASGDVAGAPGRLDDMRRQTFGKRELAGPGGLARRLIWGDRGWRIARMSPALRARLARFAVGVD